MLTRIAACRVCIAENLLVWIWIFKPNKKQSINRDTKSKVGIIAFSLDKGAVKDDCQRLTCAHATITQQAYREIAGNLTKNIGDAKG